MGIDPEFFDALPDVFGVAVAPGGELTCSKGDADGAVGGTFSRVSDIVPESEGLFGLSAGVIGEHEAVVEAGVGVDEGVEFEHVVHDEEVVEVFGVGEMREAATVGFCGGTRVGRGALAHVPEDVGAHVGAVAGGEEVFHEGGPDGDGGFGEMGAEDLVAVPGLGGCSEGVLDEGDEDVEEELAVRDGEVEGMASEDGDNFLELATGDVELE